MLNIYDLTQQEVADVLQSIPTHVVAGNRLPIFVLDYLKAQYLIDLYVKRTNAIPSLLPVQFKYLLAKSGLDQAMNTLLEELKIIDIEKYAMYKAYLNAARYYEFDKTLKMYDEIKTRLIEINQSLDFSFDQLKSMWLEASNL